MEAGGYGKTIKFGLFLVNDLLLLLSLKLVLMSRDADVLETAVNDVLGSNGSVCVLLRVFVPSTIGAS